MGEDIQGPEKWVQPDGIIPGYGIGDEVLYNNAHYVSIVNNNVWVPNQYG